MVKLVNYNESADASQSKVLNTFIEEQFDRLQTNDLVKNACRGLNLYVGDEFIEDVLNDTFDMSDMSAENRFKATYPPSEMSTSSFTILKQPTLDSNCRTVRSKNSPESFLKIVANAYSGIHRQDGMGTKLQCNLISQQPDTDNMIVHSFEFENEIEYWTFVGEIKRTIANLHSGTEHEGPERTGYCQYLPTASQVSELQAAPPHTPNGHTGPVPNNGSHTPQRKSGGSAPPASSGFFGSLFTGQREGAAKTHRWEINGKSLVIIDTHSQFRVGVAVGAITDTILGAFDLHDLVALTLSVDYSAPAAALLVASLAHSEKSRSKEKEADPTGICTSSAYNELVLDISLKRILHAAPVIENGKEVRQEMEYHPATVYRRGIGEIVVLTLSEQDILLAELADGATSTADSTATSPAVSSTVNSPYSPMGTSGVKSMRSPVSQSVSKSGIAKVSNNQPMFLHNLLEVVIHERSDSENVVGTQIVSLGDLTRGEAGGDFDGTDNVDADANKPVTKPAATSIFSAFKRKTLGADTPPAHATSTSTHPILTGENEAAPVDAHPSAQTIANRPVGATTGANATRPPLPRISTAQVASGGGLMRPSSDIKYHEPVFCDVDITLKANSKAARLVIKSATELPSSSASLAARLIPPMVYATVYLVDANGEKRSINSADSRTEAVKSFNPEWNKEVLLQNENHGVDDITTVMVLFRDAAMGILKHHHIGRVNIPFGCFLDNTQADFCLPLEATYRMNEDDEHFHLGDVHFTTELVDVGPDRKRISSFVRTQSMHASRDPGTNGAAHPALNGIAHVAADGADGSATPNGAPNGLSLPPAAPRKVAVIGTTGAKNTKNVAAVRYCLYRATAGAVWWPVRLLKTVLLNSSTGAAADKGTIVLPRKTSARQLNAIGFVASPSAYGTHADSVGFIWCGHRAIFIELAPGVTGVLYNCQECVDSVLIIAWQNVMDCLDVSEASVLLTLSINTCTSNANQISRQEMIYAPAVISLLVGPCQAAALRRECQQRAQFNFIRENITELDSAVSALAQAGAGANPRQRSSTVAKPSSPPVSPMNTNTKGSTLSEVLAANNNNSSMASMAQSTASAPTLMDILSMARAAAIALEGIIQHSEALLNRSLLLSLDGGKPAVTAARGVLSTTLLQLNPPVYNGLTADVINPKKTVLPEYSPIVKDRQSLVRTIARAKVYFAFLRHICGRLSQVPHSSLMDISVAGGPFSLPEFTTEAIQRHIKSDCENVQLFTPLRQGAKLETMVSRFESFLESAQERIRDYVIFSGGSWDTKGTHLSVETAAARSKVRSPVPGTQTAFFPDTSSHGKPDLTGKECVQMLVDAYYHTILNYLKPFIGTKDAFRKISGQEIKNLILKLVIENNFRFELSTQLTIGAPLDMKISPSMPLVEDINTVLEWYSDSLLHDTRSWLIRTLQNATNDRTNRSNLPWDVELIGDKMVSFLPETLRFQLNVYTELCSVQLTTSAHDDSEFKASAVLETGTGIGLGMSMPSGMQIHPALPVTPSLSQAAITERVNEMILHAVSEALVLLAEEYVRALQGRHWDRPDPTTGKLAVHRDFLAAIANDCHRVLTVHLLELQETIHVTPLVHNVKKAALAQAFGEPADIALRQIMRIVFTDVQSTLIEFDSLWINPKNLATRTICVAVSAHLRSLQNILCADLFFKLLGSCAQVIVLRLLLFLKARSGVKGSLSTEDITRFLRDVAHVKQCFITFMSDADSIGLNLDNGAIEPMTPLQHDVVQNLEDITYGVSAGKFITNSSFEALDVLCHLLSADYDTASFHRIAMGLVEKYEGIPASVNADGSKFKEKDALSPDYYCVPNAVLLGCIAHLRADAGAELTSFLNAILVSHEHSHRTQPGRPHSPNLESLALPYDVVVKIFASSTGLSHSQGGSSNHDTDSKGGFKGLLSPGATIKHWREKAADIAVKKGPTMVSAVKNRQNEETAMDLMRMLGLEVQSRSKHDEREATKEAQAVRRNSGKDFAAQLANSVQNGNSTHTGSTPSGSYAGEAGPLSRSLHTDLSDEVASETHDDKTAKHKNKKGGGLFHRLNKGKDHEYSSSESDADTDTTPQCLIQIEDIHVRSLHSSSFIGGPNPYVYFSINGRKRVKTSVKWDHKEASWSESVELPADLQTIQEGRITIKVFDKERMRRKRLMGTVTVRLAPLEFHSFESWYALEGGEHGNYGEVHCRLRMVNDTSAL